MFSKIKYLFLFIISPKTSVSCPNEIYNFNGVLIRNNTCEIEFINEENVIIMKWNNKISGTHLFKELTNITKIDLSHLISIGGLLDMFNGCTSLTSINFANLDTSSVSGSIARLFQNCYSLKSLDLSKLDLSKVVYLDDIFKGCKSLEYITEIYIWEKKSCFIILLNRIKPI